MKQSGFGGANTGTGLNFEREVDFQDLLSKTDGYRIGKNGSKAGLCVFYRGLIVARFFRKHELYHFLLEEKVDWRDRISKKLLPDDALLVSGTKTLVVVEVKYQQVAGSVDEKLQTCDFKRKQYLKLLAGLGYDVQYIYVLNDWFKKPEYRDVLDYIVSVNCRFCFRTLPLQWIGLPEPTRVA